MVWSIERKMTAGFVGALVILSVISVVSYRSTVGFVDTSNRVARTREVLENLEEILSLLKDAETGGRGYVITGDEQYLEHYQAALPAIQDTLTFLRQLTMENPQQQRQLDLLDSLIVQRLGLVRQLIDERRAYGFEAAQRIVLNGQGKQVMDASRVVVRAMKDEERELLQQRRAAMRTRARTTTVIIASGSLLAFAFVLVSIVLINRDIIRRRNAEEERDRFFTLSLDMLCIAGVDGYFKRLNPAWTKTLGFTEAELLARPYFDFVHPDDREATIAEAQKIAGGTETIFFENRYRCKDGSYKWLSWKARPFLDQQLVYATARDITERKEIERMKNEFISTVSHELRTPLTSIHGSLGLVAGGVAGDLPDRAQTLIAIAQKNSERLVRLINDILDIEKIESGQMVFQVQPLDVMSLVEQALDANHAYADQFGVRFVLTQAVPGATVYADSDRLMQVCTNLLSNAAKFSPPQGTVEVAVTRHDGTIRVAVTDHGPGIPEAFRSRIFQKFAQADSSDTRQKGGTGLGLSITKAIVERLGGHIWFETTADAGTTFYVALPEHQESPTVAVSGYSEEHDDGRSTPEPHPLRGR